MNKRQILILQGIQGSGKSTFARQWVDQAPEQRVRYNNDDIRNMLGPYWVPSREKLIQSIKRGFMYEAMAKGYDIVVDNMNLNPKEIQNIEFMVRDHNAHVKMVAEEYKDMVCTYEIIFKKFFTPVEECIQRDIRRPNPIGESVIRQTYEKYRSFYEECTNQKGENVSPKQ